MVDGMQTYPSLWWLLVWLIIEDDYSLAFELDLDSWLDVDIQSNKQIPLPYPSVTDLAWVNLVKNPQKNALGQTQIHASIIAKIIEHILTQIKCHSFLDEHGNQ